MEKKDLQGRGFIAMHDVRGALVSANASLTSGTSTQLISGDSSYMLDIVEATFANNSSVGAHVDLINDGTVIRGIDIPAYGTVQVGFDAPLKQNTINTPWNVDMNDITGTTVMIGATLIRQQNK